jgi:hypothetical protein
VCVGAGYKKENVMLTGRASCFFQRAGVFKVAIALLMGLLAVGLPAPRAAAQDVIHMDVFASLGGGTIYHSWTFDGASWAGWFPLQRVPVEYDNAGGPAAVASEWGREDLFVTCGYKLCHNWFDGNAGRDWGEWEVFPGPGPWMYGSQPSSASVIPGNTGAYVFVVGADRYVYQGTYTRGGRVTWQKLRSGTVARQSGVSAGPVFDFEGRHWIRLEAFGDNSEHLEQWWNNVDGAGGWQADTSIRIAGQLEHSPNSWDRFALVVPPDNSGYRYLWLDGGIYLPPGAVSWRQIGAVSPAPAAGRIDVVAAPSTGNGVFYTTYTDGAWCAWREIPGLERHTTSDVDVISWTP